MDGYQVKEVILLGSLIKKRRKKMRKHKYKKYGRKMKSRR